MAAVQDGPIESESENEIKTETSNEVPGNPGDAGGGVPPTASVAAVATEKPAAAAADSTERQTLLAVLQFLKKSKLFESEEILRREAGSVIDAPFLRYQDIRPGQHIEVDEYFKL
ncbi:UNVERIFIED_CONTAM: hypothetical protein FKN15_037236 [Acipenser sinensis]